MKRRLWLGFPALVLSGCAGTRQSAVHPGGFESGNIADLWWFFVALLGLIFLIVMALTVWTLVRKGRGLNREVEPTHTVPPPTEKRLTRAVAAGTVITVLILFGLLILSVSTGKANLAPPNAAHGLVVEVTGNQWWWYVRYLNDDASKIVVTANEIHIPTGRPVLIRGTSNDVIHSFWVPNLNGKRDLIPSRITTEWIEADQPGEYRGQCAEFCGLQHAHMALWVLAEPPDQFQNWMNRQLQGSVAPSTPNLQHGQQIFLDNACVLCHSIQGTPANGQVGPDLTHFASRKTIAAGTLPNNRGNLAGWIADPQGIKPGNHMATVPLKPGEMEPLLDYLESLQ